MEAELLMVHVCTFAKGTTFGAVHLEHIDVRNGKYKLGNSELQL